MPKPDNRFKFVLRLPTDVANKVDEVRGILRMTRTDYIQRCILRELDHFEKEEKSLFINSKLQEALDPKSVAVV